MRNEDTLVWGSLRLAPTSMQWSALSVVIHLLRAQAAFPCQKPTLYNVRLVFSKLVHAVRAGGGSLGANHGLVKAKPSSHHVHVTLW